jgi:hypothetical protein
MKTLKDAWDWYEQAKTNLFRMQRLGTHYWDENSSRGINLRDSTELWKDENFKLLTSGTIRQETTTALQPLDDLGILVLFLFSNQRSVSSSNREFPNMLFIYGPVQKFCNTMEAIPIAIIGTFR